MGVKVTLAGGPQSEMETTIAVCFKVKGDRLGAGCDRAAGRLYPCKVPILLLIVCLVAAAARAQDKPKVTVEYDRFKDRTALTLHKTRVAGTSDDDALFLLIVQSSPGRRPDPDSVITLSFFSGSAVAHFEGIAQDRELIFLADGQRIRLGDMALVDAKEGAEWVMIGLPLETLIQLAKSKILEGKAGDREFKLSTAQIGAVREFLQYIVPKRDHAPRR